MRSGLHVPQRAPDLADRVELDAAAAVAGRSRRNPVGEQRADHGESEQQAIVSFIPPLVRRLPAIASPETIPTMVSICRTPVRADQAVGRHDLRQIPYFGGLKKADRVSMRKMPSTRP